MKTITPQNSLVIKTHLTNDLLIDEILRNKSQDKEKFWEHVNSILALSYREYPDEMKEAELSAWYDRTNSNNGKTKTGRFIANLPMRPLQLIRAIYGQNLEESPYSFKDFIIQFSKRYKQFSIPNKI
jgi:hypothetical protein